MKTVTGALLALLTLLVWGVQTGFCAQASIDPAKPRQGQPALVTLEATPGVTAPKVSIGGTYFPLWRDDSGGWKGIVAIDRDARPGKVVVVFFDGVDGVGGGELVRIETEILAYDFKVQRLNVDNRTVELSPEDLERATIERVEIVGALQTKSPKKLWTKGFSLPLKGRVSGEFGVRRIYNGKPGSYHSGLDLAAPRGTEVRTSSAGRIKLVGDYFYTGNSVFIDHGYGLITGYYHLDKVLVAEGDEVGPDTVVGLVGSTGRSTGPHLHWSVYVSTIKTDPAGLVNLTNAGTGGGETP